MLILTIAVGALFIIRVPRPADEEIARLERQVHAYETALAQVANPPTATVGFRPTIDPTFLPANVSTLDPNQPTPDPFLVAQPGVVSPTPLGFIPTLDTSNALIPPTLPGGIPANVGLPVIMSVQTTLETDDQGCALNPRTVFTNTERVIGVANFVNMRAGDRITVRFFYNDTSLLIFEEVFSVELAGSFCRWYDIVPDEAGWDVGSYSVAYQINENPPTVADFTIGILSGTAEPE